MKYFLNKNSNSIHAFELDGSQDHLIDPLWESISSEQVIEINIEKQGGLSSIARTSRNTLLGQLDVILSNPLRWESFTEEKKQEFREYRQILLDIPQQPGFPEDIQWPTLPATE